MQWKLGEAKKNGASTYGWRRKLDALEWTRLVWSEEDKESFSDLDKMARDYLVGGSKGNVTGLQGTAARLAEGEGRLKIFVQVMNDIARVAKNYGYKPYEKERGEETEFRLEDNALQVFFLRPTSAPHGQPDTRYRKVGFLLNLAYKDGTPKKHFYLWIMENFNPAAMDVTKSVKTWGMTSVDQVHNKVWVVGNATSKAVPATRKAVLKFEILTKQTLKEAIDHLKCMHFLASSVFEGVPRIGLADASDIKVINATEFVTQGDEYEPKDPLMPKAKHGPYRELVNQIENSNPPSKSMLCKIEYVDVGRSLQIQIVDKDTARRTIHEQLFTEANMKRFGKIAAFDLVVYNDDRFRPMPKPGEKFSLGLANLDFDEAGRAFPLDNFDPNHPLPKDEWPEFTIIENEKCIKAYAAVVLAYLVEKTEADGFLSQQERARLEAAFAEGVERGKRTLAEFLRAHASSLKDFGEAGMRINDRIFLLYAQFYPR